MGKMNKKLFFISSSVILACSALFYCHYVFSYDAKVAHPFLIEKSVALYEQNANITFTDQEKDWIRQGAVDEDMPIRWMNHFLDPNTGKGLPGFSPANVWAKSGLAQVAYTMGDQTWNAAITAYNNEDKKNAFTALGHILHLIQDMSVPAHTRNDPHSTGDSYEDWVENNINAKYGKTELIKFDNIDNYFSSLSDYSNKYFFSKDTIELTKIFEYPEKIINNKIYLISQDNQGKDFKLIEKKVVAKKNNYALNDSVHSDYYFLLVPKAISFGAGVIDLFFKQVEFEKDKKPAISFIIKQNIAKAGGIITDSIFNFFTSYQFMVYNYETKLIDAVSSDTTSNFAAPLQITIQNKPAGRVLAASESASPEDKLVKAANVVKSKPQIPPTPFVKGGEPQIPPTLPTGQAGPFVKGGEPQIPPTLPTGQAGPFVKGGETSSPHRKGSDSLPPETNVVSAPNSVSSSTSAVFVFSSNENNSSFECDLDNAGWQECGYETNMSNLSDGSHNLKIRAKDLLNNIDQTPVEHNWIVDTAAPVISITSYPQPISTSTTANFQIDSNESETSFMCQFDMNPWQTCSATTSIADLIEGWHILEAKGIDIAGNTSSSTAITWIVDTAAPSSSVSALLAEYPSIGFSVSWSGTDGLASTTGGLSDFDIQYKIDSEEWQNWIMATTTTQAVFDIIVNNGSSVYFRSRARDSAGNQENWPDNENGDASTAIAELPFIAYDLVRDYRDTDVLINFNRDYIITTFKPAASSISGISMIASLTWTIGDFDVTLCKGTVTEENVTTKINCGSDILIARKTCIFESGYGAWQTCSFDNSFHIVPSDDYYVIVSDNSYMNIWAGATYSDTDYGPIVSCGFQKDGSEKVCLNNTLYRGFLTLKTYYDNTIPY